MPQIQPKGGRLNGCQKLGGVTDQREARAGDPEISSQMTGRCVEDRLGKQNRTGSSRVCQHLPEKPPAIRNPAVEQSKNQTGPQLAGLHGSHPPGPQCLQRGRRSKQRHRCGPPEAGMPGQRPVRHRLLHRPHRIGAQRLCRSRRRLHQGSGRRDARVERRRQRRHPPTCRTNRPDTGDMQRRSVTIIPEPVATHRITALKYQRGIGSAKAKGIAERGANRGRAWAGDRIERAARVEICQVGGRRQEPLAHSDQADGGFHRARAA